MLEEISLSNIGIIRQARLPLAAGLTILTGESGAGKSMILNSLHLLTGKRSDSSFVRHGAQEAVAEACWQLSLPCHVEAAEATGATLEDGQLFVNRSIRPDGKSRATVGGRATPAKVLQELSSGLINIHGQADQHHLRSAPAQLQALDRFGKAPLEKKLQAYRGAYGEWQQAVKARKELEATWEAKQREYRQLKAFSEALEELAPEEGELEELAQAISTLSHLDELREGLRETLTYLSPEDFEGTPPMELLQQAYSTLSKLAKYSSSLSSSVEVLDGALDALETVVKELETHQHTLDGDSIELLYSHQERQTKLQAFLKRYSLTWEELMEQVESTPKRLAELDPSAHSLEALLEVEREALAVAEASAEKLTKERAAAAKKLATAVNRELAALAMGAQKFSVELAKSKLGPRGADEVAFLLATPGAPQASPIASAASGGELSRLMLALELVLADETIPTFVFDEVDAGVGGTTAIEIGKRLALLAKRAQVIVVTHLPQVAAFADGHLKVMKTTGATATETSVVELSESGQVEEITRMLSGLSASTSGRAHAEELLAYAREFKQAS